MSRSVVSVIAVIKFEMSRSSAVIASNAHSFSGSINLRQKSSGVIVSVCFVQKNSPRLRYEFRFGKKYSLNNLRSFTAILSVSVLYSALVIWYSASGPMPHMKSSCISFFSGPTVLCHFNSPYQFGYIDFVFSFRILSESFEPLFRCKNSFSV